MTPAFMPLLHLFDQCLLRAASFVVPGRQRAEWRQEWQSELWHVRRSCARMDGVSWPAEQRVLAFCLGAFQDALCLRRQGMSIRLPHPTKQGSAAQCILALCIVMLAFYAIALLLPGVRAERNLMVGQVNPGLVMIQNAGYSDDTSPTIRPRQYRTWKARKQQYFDGFAFYRVESNSVSQESASAGSNAAAWGVAHASANLFVLLGLPLRFADPDRNAGDGLPSVILSEQLWTREFGANPHVAGTVVRVGTRRARIAGVAPNGFWKLPGKVDAWLLEPEPESAGGAGYVIAHLTPAGEAEKWAQCVHITVYGPDDSVDDLLGVSIEDYRPGPWSIYLFALLLALLALPAITSVSLGESSVSPQRTSWSRRLSRWSFLCAKIAFLLHHSVLQCIHLHPTDLHLWPLPVWPALGFARSAAKVPCLSQAGRASRPGWPGIQNLPRLERDGTDVHGRPYPAACAGNAYELVRSATVALPRYLLGLPLRRTPRRLKLPFPNPLCPIHRAPFAR